MRRGDNRAWVVGDIAYIDISTRKQPEAVALIDAADLDVVLDGGGRWQPFRNISAPQRLYVYRRPGPLATRRTIWLHRFLLGLAPDNPLVGDHINRDGLDNRRGNLRAATSMLNSANALHGRGASRFKGVSTHHTGRWRAEIRAYGTRRHLGCFDTEEAAAMAYDAAALAAFGTFALTNFPQKVAA